MGYWGTVTKRAFVLAAKDAKVDSVSGAVISFAAQTVIAVGLLFAVGLTDAAIWVRVFTFCAPYALFPLIFLVRLIQTPATLHSEQEQLIGQLRVTTSQAEKRQKIIDALSAIYLNEMGRADRNFDGDPIMYGLDLPPAEWINAKLAERGEAWSVFGIRGIEYQVMEQAW